MGNENFQKFREDTLQSLGLEKVNSGIFNGKWVATGNKSKIRSMSPIDGLVNSEITLAERKDFDGMVSNLSRVFEEWREYPAPKRGEIIKALGDALVKDKTRLGALV